LVNDGLKGVTRFTAGLRRSLSGRSTRLAAWLAPALLLPMSTTALATNGYFSHGYSASQKAMGGAGTALAEDALIVAINPAGVFWVGDQLDVNLSVFAPYREYEAGPRGGAAGPGVFTVDPARVRSDKERFYIPGIAYAARINDWSSWGLAMYGNGGLNTTYPENTAHFGQGIPLFETQCDGGFGGGVPVNGATDNLGFCGGKKSRARVDLMQLFIVPSYSVKLGEVSSIGVAPVLAGQRFGAEGLGAFARFSNSPDKVTDNGANISIGAGYRVGVLSGLIPRVGLGASYQSRVRMSRFKDYEGLFAEQGDFDIPETWNAGVSLRLTKDQRLVFDYQRINFSEVASVGNPLDPNRFVNDCALPRLLPIGGAPADSPACLGSATGPGFGWQDVTARKYGYQIAFGSLVARVGYSKATPAIPAGEVLFNILAPAVPEEHYTAGITYQFTHALSFDLGFMYARNHPVTGKNPLSNADTDLIGLFTGVLLPGAGTTATAFGPDPNDQDITLDMRQYELTLGFSYHF
jgi:long-chain fatty acid transport protein